MAYADSSLLLKLYLREPETMAASAVVQSLQESLAFTALHRLEITNAIRRNLAARRIRPGQAMRAMKLLRNSLTSGRYTRPPVDWPAVFQRAQRLSRRHARGIAVRSLDLLHVALTLELGETDFLSFDDRQREVAEAEGLAVMP